MRRGERFVLRDELGMLSKPPAASRSVALLAPLDPLVWDRAFLRTLFDFDYIWEVYVPERKRRWGQSRPPGAVRRSLGRPDRAEGKS